MKHAVRLEPTDDLKALLRAGGGVRMV